jgi:acetyl-CoA C-acetyltransferase
MSRYVITSFARTPVGAFLGELKDIPVQDLATIAMKEAVKRSSIAPDLVEGVVLGHVISTADAANLARYVALAADLREECTAFTVNRICGSGIQAVISMVQEMAGCGYEVAIAGGAEALSRVPYYLPLSVRYQPLRNGNASLICSNEEMARKTAPVGRYAEIHSMGETGENVIALMGISREDQDLFAYQSQMKAKQAIASGRFAEEIVPVEVKTRKSVEIVARDGHPRPDTTLESLARLKPVFRKDGTITAGNASGMNDAAAAMVIMTEEKANALGLEPMAIIGDYAFHGVDPTVMGLGPVGAIRKLLARTGLTLGDIDLLEINEAFAGQTLGCLKQLGNYIGTELYARLNVNGGAVALGHPLGMSGARLVGTIATEFRHRKDARWGIASACIGGGQGIALLLENPR